MTGATAQGSPLDTAGSALGPLRPSGDALGDADELNRRLARDGYLYIPGFHPRGAVLDARHDIMRALDARGALAPGTDPAAGMPAAGVAELGILSDVAARSGPLQELLYGARTAGFYELLFGEPVRHFDFSWLRAIPPGPGTKPHGDSVYMNRGTSNLLTAWIPLGDVDVVAGGLTILEGSHRLDHVRRDYGDRDVDTYCVGAPEDSPKWPGWISEDPQGLREHLGLRWLTGSFTAGDLLTFTPYTLHASLDNNSDRFRLSVDIRYQRASEPADPRWVGPVPTAHGPDSQQGLIC